MFSHNFVENVAATVLFSDKIFLLGLIHFFVYVEVLSKAVSTMDRYFMAYANNIYLAVEYIE